MTTGAFRFVLSIEPAAGESLPGYVMRLAERTLLPTADMVAARAGLRQPGLAFHYASLSGLAAMANVSIERLEDLAYRPTSRAGHHRFLDGVLQREFIDLKRRRACPACLAHVPVHRAAWDLALATCCMVHGTRLIRTCPACERPLTWSVSDLTRCRCGARITSCTPTLVSSAERTSQASLLAIAAGGDMPAIAPDLTDADRADLVRLIMCLGMFLTGWRRERRIETLAAAGPDAVARVVAAGIQCLGDWPVSLAAFFSRERETAATRRGKYGARKTLGAFYDWLNMMEDGPIRSALARAASGFLDADPVLARLSHRSTLVAATSHPRRPVTMAEARRLLGVREQKVKKLAQTGLLDGQVSTGSGSIGLLDGGTVERLAAVMEDALDLAKTARALAISKARLRRLVDAGVLVPVHRGNASGWGRWMFARASVDELLGKLVSKAIAETRTTVGFETSVEILRRRGVGLTDMLRAIMDGSLVVHGLDPQAPGLKALRFCEADLRCLGSSCQDPTRGLSIQETARELGLKWQVVSHLVRVGILNGGQGGVPVASLSAFRETFVSGAELARAHHTSPRQLAAVLAKEGVHPVVGPAVDGSRQNFYVRLKVHNALAVR